MRRTILGLALASALGVTTATALAQQKGTEAPPDATLTFSGGSVAIGIGYSWGGGTLAFKGQRHDFTANGLNVINVGASSVEATGDVYHLAKLEDFNGTYSSIGAGATLVGGGTVAFMENENGVVIKLSSQQKGLQLSLPVGGVRMQLKS
jgi:hypothetical protein